MYHKINSVRPIILFVPFLICKFSDFVIYCSQPQKYEHCKFQIAADSKSGCCDLLLKFGKHKYFQVAKPLCFCSNPFTSDKVTCGHHDVRSK